MSDESLIEENKILRQKLKDKNDDLKEVARILYKVTEVLGITGQDMENGKKAKKKVLKAMSGIATDAFINPTSIEERFAFFKDFKPLFEKNEDLINEIKAENEK